MESSSLMRLLIASLLLWCLPGPLRGADWPTWRHDAGRTAASPQELDATLHLQWVREYPPLKPAWPDQPMLQPDAAYEPVVQGKTVFVASSRNDCLTALDAVTGAERWRFDADGPVRFAPAVWQDKVYFVSDDGHLYCLDAAGGRLLWKFRGGPADRRVLGNERLISTWPARGAPVVHDGKVYFAAGIWPFMGIFIHALDAETGEVVWTNDGDGSVYIKQPHNADSFAGVAPQGHLVVTGDRLLVPGGRSIPASFDLKTGKLLRYQLAENGKRGGGATVAAVGRFFCNGGAAFDVRTQKFLGPFAEQVALTAEAAHTWSAGVCRSLDLKNAALKEEETTDRKGEKVKTAKWEVAQLGACKLPKVEALIKAGGRLYVGMPGRVAALDLPLTERSAPSWEAAVDGTPVSLVAAADRLFAVTREGRIYCFGAEKVEPVTWRRTRVAAEPADTWTARAKAILETTGVRDGFCIAWGVGSGRLILELARQSDLRIIVVERDPRKVSVLRGRLVAAGLYGERVAVHAGDPLTFPLPPYLASLMVAEDLQGAGIEPGVAFARKVFHALRPYGGVACLPLAADKRRDFIREVAEAKLPGAVVREWPGGVLLRRDGPLPGSADWTHQHADAANTRVSNDGLVKAPLGVLWFGGPSHDGILPRHGNGPQPQVQGGRLFIQGTDLLRATDVYTGRLLWEASLPGVGRLYNNVLHQPGANASGTNYISLPDGIYVAYGRACLRLDPATGKHVAIFTLPPAPGAEESPRWGYINVAGDYLVGGADPLFDPKLDQKRKDSNPKAASGLQGGRGGPAGKDTKPSGQGKKAKGDDGLERLVKKFKSADNDNFSSSKHLVVMNRHTGKVLCSAQAGNGFRHNAICIGGGRLYAIDRLSGPEISRLHRRGEEPKLFPRLVAFDLATGKEVWSTEVEVFGTWLSYSAKHDVLVESGYVGGDTLSDEPKGMRAYGADTGKVLWHQPKYVGPAIIHGDTVLKDRSACDLMTGAPKMRSDPLTGALVEWTWTRNHGCNMPAASKHLLTFRSGAAGYFDLSNDGGTGNLGGFRSGCTNNLIVADGVLSAPDYTRTCTCAYQNQTSLALIHMPEAEMWTFFGPGVGKGPVRRLGLNLGAPGNRRADDGTLWLEYPTVGGKSPTVPVEVAPAKVEWFRRHSSQVSGPLAWVGASGVKGLESLRITLDKEGGRRREYTVRLWFVEPDGLPPGKRLFNVALQGKEVLKDFDVAREAGGSARSLVKEFRGVAVTRTLEVRLTRTPGAESAAPVLCGVEVAEEPAGE